MRVPRMNEGSMIRRILLHVSTMVVGSLAFVTIVSFVLVTVAKAALPHRGTGSDKASTSAAADDDDDAAPEATSTSAAAKATPKVKRRPKASSNTPPPSAGE